MMAGRLLLWFARFSVEADPVSNDCVLLLRNNAGAMIPAWFNFVVHHSPQEPNTQTWNQIKHTLRQDWHADHAHSCECGIGEHLIFDDLEYRVQFELVWS